MSTIPADQGAGYLASMPDLPGCSAHGATIDEAITEAGNAFKAWVIAAQQPEQQ